MIFGRETARQEIRLDWRKIAAAITGEAKQKVNRETSYICPLCGHGTHGDGLTVNPKSKDGTGLKCFGCGFSGDIIDLVMKTTGKDYNAALAECGSILGIEIEPYRLDVAGRKPSATASRAAERPQDGGIEQGNADTPKAGNAAQRGTEAAEMDFTAYYRECQGRLTDPAAVSYLTERGISVATAAAYGVGFDPEADPAQSGHKAPRIIIPTCSTHYVGRSIDPATEKKYCKLNNKGGTPAIFNEQALYAHDVQAVFVTEGPFDALSVLEAGAPAIALCSTSNAQMLVDRLKENRTAATLILCLDTDSAGKKATEVLRDGLQRLNVSFIASDICCGHKDPNEALVADRDAFIDAVEQAQHKTAAKPDNVLFYMDQLMSGDIDRFREAKYTGFPDLDDQAGGLYSGLYAVAAIPSLGKTTFCHQMADQLAAAGNDVLFFSLEQSRLELVSKSIARKTAINDMDTAVTSLAIRQGYLPKQVINAAEQYKRDVQDRMSVIEGNFACNISFIGDYVRQYVRRTGTRPVCFIDYLQILQPEQNIGRQQSTKETIDSSITELKRLSRELDLTIFVICSLNRTNYLNPVDFESLKESGSIEYTCDVVWGLQLQCLNSDLFDRGKSSFDIKACRNRIKEAKAANPRKIELCCLKNRYGVANFSCYFKYYPANDLFTVCSEAELDFTLDDSKKQHKAGRNS